MASGISLPAYMYEPLTILQRTCECIENNYLLDDASKEKDSLDRFHLICFSISSSPQVWLTSVPSQSVRTQELRILERRRTSIPSWVKLSSLLMSATILGILESRSVITLPSVLSTFPMSVGCSIRILRPRRSLWAIVWILILTGEVISTSLIPVITFTSLILAHACITLSSARCGLSTMATSPLRMSARKRSSRLLSRRLAFSRARSLESLPTFSMPQEKRRSSSPENGTMPSTWNG